MLDRSTGITCYAVTADQGFVDGCADEVTLQTIPLPMAGGRSWCSRTWTGSV